MTSSKAEPPKSAIFDSHGWLSGNNPSGFFSDAALRAQLIRNDPGKLRVRTNESYFKSKASLILVDHLARPETGDQDFTALNQLPSVIATGEPSQ